MDEPHKNARSRGKPGGLFGYLPGVPTPGSLKCNQNPEGVTRSGVRIRSIGGEISGLAGIDGIFHVVACLVNNKQQIIGCMSLLHLGAGRNEQNRKQDVVTSIRFRSKGRMWPL